MTKVVCFGVGNLRNVVMTNLEMGFHCFCIYRIGNLIYKIEICTPNPLVWPGVPERILH